MAIKDRILVLGSTGSIGRHIVWASVKAGNPTFVLVRSNTSYVRVSLVKAANPETKEELLQSFKNSGVIIIEGDINDHETLVKAMKQVDVVICAAGRLLIEDQVKIIAAIKEAGNVKRFFPSEFGLDVDRHDSVDPVREVFVEKAKVRRIIEAEGIPYTYLCCHAFTGYFLRNLAQINNIVVPPREKVVILGDGNVKGAFVTEVDAGTYTIEAANDPTALNKAVHVRLPANYLTFNEIISLWEKKIGKTLEKTYVPEEQVLKDIKEASFPNNYLLALYHSQQIKGDAVYEIDPAKDVEASESYPHVKYTTVDEYLNQFV
ncbi:isoflavone reductase isoform X2 [Cajanus cajan]|uniref:Isoflavone reductase n=1 Tax=Cajanus cajan TaxID=3821 RepID=A0A151TIA6_CAJCA|nr:isoflavone reductase isoform X2 [Cajanus cajan]KYP66787.1 Isoflavone reductase [Cajanus cajan]